MRLVAVPRVSIPTATLQPTLSCTRCGYDLRGLRREARCPECGTPLVLSLYGEYLRHQPAAWIGRLVRGSAWFLGAQAGWLALTAYWLVRHGSYDWNVMVASPVAGVVSPLLLTAATLVGVVLLTWPNPVRTDSILSPRRLLRVGTAVMAVLCVMGYLPALREPPEPKFWVPFGVLQAATSLVTGLFVMTVALRLPDRQLAVEAVLAASGTALVEAALYVYPWFAFHWPYTRRFIIAGQEGPLQTTLWGLGGYGLFVMVRLYFALAAALESAAGAEAVAGDGRAARPSDAP